MLLLQFLLPLGMVQLVSSGLNELCLQMDFYAGDGLAHCLLYDDYGCWCGPGGSGKPVDEADSCCRSHDHCYDKILKTKKCNPYLDQYRFHQSKCLDDPDTCLYQLCKCDQTIAKCLLKTTYHWWYYGYRTFHHCQSSWKLRHSWNPHRYNKLYSKNSYLYRKFKPSL